MNSSLILSQILFLAFLFIHLNNIAQNKVTGIIIDHNGHPIHGAIILEEGSEKRDTTDATGRFIITTLKDTSTLTFSWIGFFPKTIKITQDTAFIITLKIWSYENHFITLGANYDPLNSIFGFLISNGLDEQPLIHFEEFSEEWLYKLDGATNFQKDYSLGAKFGKYGLNRYFVRPMLEYRRVSYPSKEFQHTDINLSIVTGWQRFPGDFWIKTGYQHLNGKNNLGAELGWQTFYRSSLHYGFSLGYWDDYMTYHVFLQGLSLKKKIGIRATYDRIENFDFLNIGIHFTFTR